MPKKKIKGTVVSNKMVNTVVVDALILKRHPVYQKLMRLNKRYQAHDELGAVEGDRVLIEETAPVSKTKHFKVIEILKEE